MGKYQPTGKNMTLEGRRAKAELDRQRKEYMPPCTQDPELWWSMDREEIQDAKRWCQTCPLQKACAAYALAAREEFGVWGGLDANDRAVINRRIDNEKKRKDERARRARLRERRANGL